MLGVDVYFSTTMSNDIADYTFLGQIPVDVGQSPVNFSNLITYFNTLLSSTDFSNRPSDPLDNDAELSESGQTLVSMTGINQAIPIPSYAAPNVLEKVNPLVQHFSFFSDESGYYAFTSEGNPYFFRSAITRVTDPDYNEWMRFDGTDYALVDKANKTVVSSASDDLGGWFYFIAGGIIPKRVSTANQIVSDINIITRTADSHFVGIGIRVLSRGSASDWNNSLRIGTSTTFSAETDEFFSALGEYEGNDPFAPGGSTGVGGGTGTFSGTGDAIGIPSLPTLSATSAGFITLFNPSAAQMASLAAYMWSGAFDLNTFRKIFADPMDCILGLSIVPVDVSAGSSAEVKVGNIGTGIYMTTAASQYVEVDCGTLNVEEFWGAYLDYDPYTKAEIYLPYIGTHPIAVDDIMGKSVHVVYHVDILSGACVAYVQCGDSVLYSFIGQCSSSIPISGNDWTNVVNGVLSIAGSIGSMVATGGASAPTAVGSIVSTAANQMKPSVEKSGSLSGTGGMMGIQVPYLILTRPRQALPAKQNAYTGYPSFINSNLGSLIGYTEVEEIHLENVPATSGELAEIVSLLKGGVIF